jgi:sugar phosphate isomerase/epimerase
MNVVFGKSKWEMWGEELKSFLSLVKKDGFNATEIYVQSLFESTEEIVDLHQEHGLDLVGMLMTQGKKPEDHLHDLQEQYARVIPCRPVMINCHVGRDFFTFDENLTIYTELIRLSEESGIPTMVETHRGRPTYSLIETLRYLDTLPELQLTADFSHWMVVHESDLTDQEKSLSYAIERTGYIQARVGFSEGPQINDPRAPEWNGMVQRHLDLWKRIVNCHRQNDKPSVYITPEFGPPPYMPTLPLTNQPVGNVWEINVYMKDLLEKELAK